MDRLISKSAIDAWNASRRSRREAAELILDQIQDEGCVDRDGIHRHPRSERFKVCETPSYVVTFDCDHDEDVLHVMFIYRQGSTAARRLMADIRLVLGDAPIALA